MNEHIQLPIFFQIITSKVHLFLKNYFRCGLVNYGILLSILIMISFKSFGQVKIIEKVTISPNSSQFGNQKFANINSTSHSLRALHHWEPSYLGGDINIPLNRMRFKFTANFCNKTIYSEYDYSGKLDFSTNDLLGTSYSVQLLLSSRTQWDPEFKNEHVHGAPFQIFIDGELKTSYDDYWFGYLGIDIRGNDISYFDFSTDVNSYTLKSCDPIIGRLNEDFPYITISQGTEHLSFYDEALDDTLDDSYYLGDYLNGGELPVLIYDEPYFKSIPLYGKIEATVNGFTAVDSIKINTVNDFDLIVETNPEKISPGDESKITLNYLSVFGDTIQFSSTQLFDIELIEGADLGTLVSGYNMDTSDVFDQIRQPFFFIAKENINRDSAEILVRVSAKIDDIYSTPGLNDKTMDRNYMKSSSLSSNSIPEQSKKYRDKNIDNMAIIFPPDECREIFGLGRVIIEKRDSIDHFEITIIPDTLYEKDTLAFTEKGGIFVQAKDNDSNDVDMDPYKKLKFQITSNFEYGTFIDLNGDTVKLATPIVEDVQYSDAVKGKIKFAAVRENPDSVIKCNIKVSLQEDTSKYGQHKAIVLEQTLRIIMNEPLEVQPLITGHKNDPEHNTYLKIIEESNKKTFRVLHTRGGIEVKMHKIKLTANYIDGSGGHDHTTPRRPDSEFSYTRGEKFIEIPAERIRRQNYGSFYALRDSPFNSEFLHGKEYIRSTKDTVTKFQYIASLWGDSIKIFLQSLENDKLIPDTIVIAEKIPGMQLLQENENYILIGGTDNHYGPPTFSTDHNHFGTTILCQAINNITKDYRGLNPGVKIRVNDMSLENGGKFDIGGQWRGSHAQHRIGKNVDISGKGLNDSGNLVNINIIQMRKSIRDRTGLKPLYHNPPHFHVYTN